MDNPVPQDLIIPETLPLLPVRDVVVFPYMILPLFVGRDKSVAAVEAALAGDRLIMLAAQKEFGEEEPSTEDIYPVGTVAMIMRMLKMPDGRVKILVQGLAKARLTGFAAEEPYFKVHVERLHEPLIDPALEVEALMRTVRNQLGQAVSLGKGISPEVLVVVENMEDAGSLADVIASNVGLKVAEAQEVIEILDPLERLRRVKDILARELELLSMQADIQTQAKEEMGKSQREYFLREQLRAIQGELGDADPRAQDVAELREKLEKAGLPKEAREEADKQLRRLETMHAESAEYSMQRTYLDWLVELPWKKTTRDNLNLAKAHQVLDEDHYNLEKIKERILEFLAVRKLKKEMKGPILCFVGPPGVGKTSLGKSIARALGRKFVRISLGGMRDEAEIRGHRRTYVGALPGRIIQGLKQAGTNNPVFMLDEIDKLGMDFRGDPSSALLEVLDPEQNHAFSDHYINLAFDLSNVMFIATANIMDPVPSALKDRMEVIRLSGYTAEEKQHIAERYLIPRQREANGLKDNQIHFSRPALLRLITEYTAEAGLRNLEREIGSICRKVARRFAEDRQKSAVRVTEAAVERFLGAPRFLPEEERDQNEVGVATGLAWTEVGGDVLYIEVNTMKGKGALTLTGHLGDVMKESAQAALSYARSRAEELGIDPAFFESHDIHVHVPAGAIPKDGPSAGVTMAVALISALTKRPVSKDVAMTGELTLRGKVLPIGGLKEKVLAAVRHHIGTVLMPQRNEKDLEDIPAHLRKKVKLVPVRTMADVLKAALVDKT
ncbi:ATP-dependent proteinase. Serine peptidase. MEROPS family S16 [Geoalkalibacter ferrihydriticus]|uniref:Lon protease n=1 Tax=Geoalkalibacter ferrihydriticus TaxID=392333 RepID=A0A1G9MXW3_9BACT|nr:endopeptidase La [Geoalkalibacter ferrihydriticus]SDL79112.1 ATP-dependent proteinase. Serine peptidase. MEROPS family S16 [Geoalkalibacter ferrihydriticus]